MPVYLIERREDYNNYIQAGVRFDAKICDAMYIRNNHKENHLAACVFSGRGDISNKEKLREYIGTLNKPEIGDVFNYVDDKTEMNHLFVVLPNGNVARTPEILLSCYYNALKYAEEHNFKTVYLPVFYIGSMSYRTSVAYTSAVTAVNRIISDNNDMNIYLDIKADCRPGEAYKYTSNKSRARLSPDWEKEYSSVMEDTKFIRQMVSSVFKPPVQNEPQIIVETKTEYVNVSPRFDRSKFSECIDKYLKNASITQTKLANRACIDKGTLSKLINYKSNSKPQKNTVVSIAIAIGFDEEKRKEFIMLGGYTYPDDDRDKKIEECINNGIKTVSDINDKLSENDYDILTKDNYNTKENSQNKNKSFHRKKPDKTAKSRS